MKEKSAARSDRAKIAEKVLHVEPTQPTPVEEARPRQPPSRLSPVHLVIVRVGPFWTELCPGEAETTFQGVQDRSSCQVSGGVSNGALGEHNPMV